MFISVMLDVKLPMVAQHLPFIANLLLDHQTAFCMAKDHMWQEQVHLMLFAIYFQVII